MNFPVIGERLPHRGNRFTVLLAQWAMGAAGWQIRGNFPNAPKLVAIVAPHTSNWDFIVGVGAIFALQLKVKFLAKHTLFRWPLGWLMRSLGGMPVDRSRQHGVVAQVSEDFARHASLLLAITPEGTRTRGVRWKEGFYHIALAARAAIVPVTFDYRARVVFIGPSLVPTGDAAAEIARLKGYCDGDEHAARQRPAVN